MALPEISPEKRAAALKRAAEVRSERAALLKSVKAGEKSIADVIAMDTVTAQHTRVASLIKAKPGIGKAKCEKIMAEIGIDPKRRVSGLGSHQRAALIEALDA